MIPKIRAVFPSDIVSTTFKIPYNKKKIHKINSNFGVDVTPAKWGSTLEPNARVADTQARWPNFRLLHNHGYLTTCTLGFAN